MHVLSYVTLMSYVCSHACALTCVCALTRVVAAVSSQIYALLGGSLVRISLLRHSRCISWLRTGHLEVQM